jgi:hypothetical protein
MKHSLLRFIPSVAAIAALPVLWWAGLPALAVLLAVVCGLAGVLYFVAGGARRAGDGRSENEREGNERFLRDIPPPSSG